MKKGRERGKMVRKGRMWEKTDYKWKNEGRRGRGKKKHPPPPPPPPRLHPYGQHTLSYLEMFRREYLCEGAVRCPQVVVVLQELGVRVHVEHRKPQLLQLCRVQK